MKTSFSYMNSSPIANFVDGAGLAIGAGVGLLAGAVGSGIYRTQSYNNNASDRERSLLMKKANRFNKDYDAYMATKPQFLQNANDSAEGRRFANSGNDFVNYNQEQLDKHSNPYLAAGITAGGLATGALAGGLLSKVANRH